MYYLNVNPRRHAAAAIVGANHAYYESYIDLLSALRSLAAGAKTGDLFLGYNTPLHVSSARLPAPQTLREQEAANDATHGLSHHDEAVLSRSPSPATPQPESVRFSAQPSLAFAVNPDTSHSHPSAPSPLNSASTSASPSTGPSYPRPYIGPLPTVPWNMRVSNKNKTYCYVVWIGRRPGIYFTWYVLSLTLWLPFSYHILVFIFGKG